MSEEEIFFFEPMPGALGLYAVLSEQIKRAFPLVKVQVAKTQITFRERYGFAFVSLRRTKGCPKVFLLVSFGLSHRLDSPRILSAAQPYPNRWTHHVLVQCEEEIDAELLEWLQEAHHFSLRK